MAGTLGQMGAQGDNIGRIGGGASERWDPAHYKPEGTLRVIVSHDIIKHLFLAHQLLTLCTYSVKGGLSSILFTIKCRET